MTKQRRPRLAESQAAKGPRASQPDERPSSQELPEIPARSAEASANAAAAPAARSASAEYPIRPSDPGQLLSPTALQRKQCPSCGERYPADFRVCPRDATQLQAVSEHDDDPLLGTVLGDTYQVLRVIGEGGMGRVFEARHIRLFSKRFAIKVLHGDLTRQPEVVGRFLREAEATSALHHPNIVGVLDVNQVPDGRPYIVAELLEGDQLGDYLERKGKLPVDEAVAICRPICQALIAAHDKDIVHRDIKPENLFLVGEGARRTTKVLDFGISRVGDAAGSLTKTGMVMGTPAYMPPEQARGTRVDHRADIYAVGAILYEALTGQRPFQGTDPISTLASVLTTDPPRPRSLVATLPPGLELVVQKAMAKTPDERYASMRELDEALAAFDVSAPAPEARSQERQSLAPQRPSLANPGLHRRLVQLWDSEASAPEQARISLVAVSLAGACYLFAGLIETSIGVVRWVRPGSPLTSTEIVLAALGSAGLLIAPCIAWARYLFGVWTSTPRVIDVLARAKRVLSASLVTYAATTLGVRVFAGAFHSDPSGASWPGWGVLEFGVSALVGAAAAWLTWHSRKPVE